MIAPARGLVFTSADQQRKILTGPQKIRKSMLINVCTHRERALIYAEYCYY